nr:hypothetical protein [Tanacetum cinerariifolium]
MANLSEDIQSVGSDTRPPMLDRPDFESWQQCIHLYCLGKDNGENIIKSIDEGPFKMRKFKETLAEGALHLGPEQDKVVADLTLEEKERYKADIRVTNNLLKTKQRSGNNGRGAIAAGNGGVQNRVGNVNLDKMLLMQAQENEVVVDEEQLLFIAGGQANTFDDDVDEPLVQDLALTMDNIFQADQCDVFDYDVDEAPTTQTIFMTAQCISANEQNKVVNESLTVELARYKELVGVYKKRARPYYDEKKNVAIGYKNPLYLTCVMQVQSALYNGHEIVKTNHAPAVVHDSEDTLGIAEITRKKMLEKINGPLCVEKKVKFDPETNFSNDGVFTNTPARLVSRVLPTKSQVKINTYTLIQPFAKFDKTCKKRITPCGLTEWERGFEQTKECYLTKVIPFFKMLKEHFEGIQTALVKEVKEMKEIFEQMEVEVEQNVVDEQCANIERKNLLIENENLIVDYLSHTLL